MAKANEMIKRSVLKQFCLTHADEKAFWTLSVIYRPEVRSRTIVSKFLDRHAGELRVQVI